MKQLLITGFDPFGGAKINPSWLAVEQLPDRIGNYAVCKLQIPTCFGVAAQLVLQKAEQLEPDLILSVGVAGGRDAVTPERIAVNIRDAWIPDNRGFQPKGELVHAQGPAAYFATVPVEEMARAIRDAGVRAAVSNTAGTFVCNDVMYALLHRFAGTKTRTGFIHVPQLPDGPLPGMPLEEIVKALKAAIEACEK